jgi:integrase
VIVHRGATRRTGTTQAADSSSGQQQGNRIHGNRRDPRPEKRNAAQRYLAKLVPSGRRSQRWALNEMGTIWKRKPVKDGSRLAWSRISTGAIDRIREELAAKYAVATANRALVALRRVLRFSWQDQSLSYDDYLRLIDVIEPIRGEGGLRGRAVPQIELDRLYAACDADRTASGARDGAVIALAHAAGMRAGEIVGMDLEDVMDLDGGELLVWGKGGTRRQASLGTMVPWLAAWVRVRGSSPGPLIYHVLRWGQVVPTRLTPRAVFQIVKKRAAEAGVLNVSPHCLRKTHATALLREGFDHLMVMRSLRQKDVRSVKAYDRRTEDERAAAQRKAIRGPLPGGGA